MVHKAARQYIFSFGAGARQADGDAAMKSLLGERGARLAELAQAGFPVPPGFTISTEACAYYTRNENRFPPGLEEQLAAALRKLETQTGRKLGDPRNPLLVSIRCGAGAPVSGLLETLLNVGLSEQTVAGLTEMTGDERVALWCLAQFIAQYGSEVGGLDARDFEQEKNRLKDRFGVATDAELDAGHLRELCAAYRRLPADRGQASLPEPAGQLLPAIAAAFRSWNSARAEQYRRAHRAAGLLGAAVHIQAMVLGNAGPDSGSGRIASRDPITGAARPTGRFIAGAQGAALASGVLPATDLHDMPRLSPSWRKLYEQLPDLLRRLETHFRYPQEIEFTVEKGRLWLLDAAPARPLGHAGVRWAVEMAAGQDFFTGRPLPRVLKTEEALLTIGADELAALLSPRFDAEAERKGSVLARGLAAAPGAAAGRIVLSLRQAELLSQKKRPDPLILVARDIPPAEAALPRFVSGILADSPAAGAMLLAAARFHGRACVTNVPAFSFNPRLRTVTLNSTMLREGDWISLNGFTGAIYAGRLPLAENPVLDGAAGGRKAAQKHPLYRIYRQLSDWADKLRTIRVLADCGSLDAVRAARGLGADGIGFFRLEGLLQTGGRARLVREFLLGESDAQREPARTGLLKALRDELEPLFEIMNGCATGVRLLEIQASEWLDPAGGEIAELARHWKCGIEPLLARASRLLRDGVREEDRQAWWRVQTQAVIEAAGNVEKRGFKVAPIVFIPAAGPGPGLDAAFQAGRAVAEELIRTGKFRFRCQWAAAVSTPRAALLADTLAEGIDGIGFEAWALTRWVFGLETAGPEDPYLALDIPSVGQLIENATRKGRETHPTLRCGIHGKAAADAAGVRFAMKIGQQYVSCPACCVPLARLAAAQAALKQ